MSQANVKHNKTQILVLNSSRKIYTIIMNKLKEKPSQNIFILMNNNNNNNRKMKNKRKFATKFCFQIFVKQKLKKKKIKIIQLSEMSQSSKSYMTIIQANIIIATTKLKNPKPN